MRTSNPFVHARALTPDESIERDERARLLELASAGHNAVVHAPRRFGKTTLLKQVLRGASERDMPGVFVDLSDVLSVPDVGARLEQAFRALPGQVRRIVSRELGSVAVTTPVAGLSFSRRAPVSDPIVAVHALLELPAQIAARRAQRVVVVLDEFQSLVNLGGLDGVFRSHIQHHSAVSYVFAGSEQSLLRALFEDRARPLYAQAERVRLQRLDSTAAHDFLVRRFSETGKDIGEASAQAVRIADGHPQRLMLIAHLLWDRTREGRAASLADLRSAFDAAMRLVDPELRYLWDALTANERRVLAALASGLSPYQREAAHVVGLAGRSSAARAADGLEAKGIIEPAEDEFRIVDPLLDRWVRRHGGARRQVHVIRHGGRFAVTDGPSLAFLRSTHETLEDAVGEAQRIAADGRGAEIVIYDTDDPNDLPDWGLAHPSES